MSSLSIVHSPFSSVSLISDLFSRLWTRLLCISNIVHGNCSTFCNALLVSRPFIKDDWKYLITAILKLFRNYFSERGSQFFGGIKKRFLNFHDFFRLTKVPRDPGSQDRIFPRLWILELVFQHSVEIPRGLRQILIEKKYPEAYDKF